MVEAAPAFLALRLHAEIPADVGLVHFDHATIRAEQFQAHILHRLADAMGQEPRRFDGNAERALQLVPADPLLLEAIRKIAWSHRRRGMCEDSNMVPTLTVKGLRHA
jgi:hypothetical protein